MTSLGAVFLFVYAVAALRGRRGVLCASAAAIPFQDSAALVVGGLPITPFYLGAIVYLVMFVTSPLAMRRSSSDAYPLSLLLWCACVTIAGPTIFLGFPVVASGLGLDEQVGRLASLHYTSSNFAQMAYLAINVCLLLAAMRSRDFTRTHAVVAAGIGTMVGVVAWFVLLLGGTWPQDFFTNNSRNNYVESPRLSAQFSEPSHLGTFALVSFVLFFALSIQARGRIRLVLLLACFADILLLIQSASATALAGAGLILALGAVWALRRFVLSGGVMSPGSLFVGLFSVGAAVFAVPIVWNFLNGILEYKLARGTSISGRTAADSNGWELFVETYFLGVGLGSNRTSSMLLLLLSTVGIVGTLLFFALLGRAMWVARRGPEMASVILALLALVIAQLVAQADLVSPFMWLLMGICFSSSASLVEGSRRPPARGRGSRCMTSASNHK